MLNPGTLPKAADVAPSAWRRHLHWLLDGLRAEVATPPPVGPLSAEQFEASVQAQRSRRPGRRRAPGAGTGT